MKILVTGGAGYIGSHTVQALLKTSLFKFDSVVVFDNLTTGFSEAIPDEVQFIKGDVRDTDLLSETLIKYGIDTVIHFAAKLIVPESVEKPIEYYDHNVNGIISVANACLNAGVKKIIFSSTAAVYGEPTEPKPISESTFPSPINPYGASKLMGERILKDCEVAFGLRSVCLRYFNVAGAAQDGTNGQRSSNVTHLIHVACQAALGLRDHAAIFGTDFSTRDGTGVRDYIHVEDLAELHLRAALHLHNTESSEVLNCGYGNGFSVYEVLESMKKVSGVNFDIRKTSRRAGDPSSLIANVEKIKKLFSWTPQYASLELICQSALNWEKSKA